MKGRLSASGRLPVFGTPFSVLDEDYADPNGERDVTNLWVIPNGGGLAKQITFEPLVLYGSGQHYLYYPILSPDRSKILHLYGDDGSADDWLYVMNADTSGRTQLRPSPTVNPEWIGNAAISFNVYDGTDEFSRPIFTTIRRIDADGSNEATILTKAEIGAAHPSPDGTRIAYTADDGTDTWTVGICDADGSNDTVLVADTGVPAGQGGGQPVWRLDGSAIMYWSNGAMKTIEPDGSNEVIHAATMPAGFWFTCGMADDRFFYTDTSAHPNWNLGQVVFGVGQSLVSPTRRLALAAQRGVALYDPTQGRVFSNTYDTGPDGQEETFSLLPDGTDYQLHFEPDYSSNPLFQVQSFR